MNKTLIVVLAVVGSLVAGLFVLGGFVASSYNRHVTLTTLYDAKLKSNEASFDNTWKKISQVAQVADSQRDALKQIFVEHANARNSGGSKDGSLMKWIQESVPNVDVSVYKNLQNIITSARDSWTQNQNELVDVSREYNMFIRQFPNNMVAAVFGWQTITPKVITSSRTQNAFETEKDDNVSLK